MYHFDRGVKLSIYKTYIRPLLKYATHVFKGNLSKTQVNSLEHVNEELWLLLWGLTATRLM